MRVDAEEQDLEPCDVFVDLGMLVVEGRTPGLTGRGYGEGPHCPPVSGQSPHRCDPQEPQCSREERFRKHMMLLWRNNIPMSIEVLLSPDCCHNDTRTQGVESLAAPEPSHILLEQWLFQLLPKRAPDVTMTGKNLLLAIRSYLHFSQLSAWYSLSGGKAPRNVMYRICVPGEAFSNKFSSEPDVHSFPMANIGRTNAMKVTVRAMPRGQSVPQVRCPIHERENEALKLAAACALPTPPEHHLTVHDKALAHQNLKVIAVDTVRRARDTHQDPLLGDCLLDPPQGLHMYPKRFQSPSRSGSPVMEAPEHLMFGSSARESRESRSQSSFDARSERSRHRRHLTEKSLEKPPDEVRIMPLVEKRPSPEACVFPKSKPPGATTYFALTPKETEEILNVLRQRECRPCTSYGKARSPSASVDYAYLPTKAFPTDQLTASSSTAHPDNVAAGTSSRKTVLETLAEDVCTKNKSSKAAVARTSWPEKCPDTGRTSWPEKCPDAGRTSWPEKCTDAQRTSWPEKCSDAQRTGWPGKCPDGERTSWPEKCPDAQRTSWPEKCPDAGMTSWPEKYPDAGRTSWAGKYPSPCVAKANKAPHRKPAITDVPMPMSDMETGPLVDEAQVHYNGMIWQSDLASAIDKLKLQKEQQQQELQQQRCDVKSVWTPDKGDLLTYLESSSNKTLARQLFSKQLLSLAEAKAAEASASKLVPTATDKANFRRSLDSATSMVFHCKTGLPLTSSPAPLRKGNCFDFDSTLTSVAALKAALFDKDEEQELELPLPLLSTSAPASITSSSLLGSFEESVLNGRLEPVSTVEGFTAEIGASGSFCPRHITLPVTVFFYTLSDTDKVSTPYLGHINLGSKGYHVPKTGTVQVTLFNPHGTVVKMFVVMYNLNDMPTNCQTFLRQRTLYMPVGARDDDPEASKWLRYLIHLRFSSSKSGRIYLHTDVRMVIFRKSDIDAATIFGTYELRSFTRGPTNPKFSPKR